MHARTVMADARGRLCDNPGNTPRTIPPPREARPLCIIYEICRFPSPHSYRNAVRAE